MRTSVLRAVVAAGLGALAPALAACGGGGAGGQPGERTATPKRGGTLKVLSEGDVDHIDPGAAYYQLTYMITQATQRSLYQFKGGEVDTPVPDLAASDPEVSPDGKTVRVRIKPGIRFSPPVDREVTARDVEYAIERGFSQAVGNGYADRYFGDVEGAPAEPAKSVPDIEGIAAPDDRTIVFRLRRATGRVLAGALALPLSAPVPREYARRFDRQTPSTYGAHQVATGPYMIQNDASGKVVGYQPARRIVLVRNPRWDPKTDYRHAYVDRVEWSQGNDMSVASRQILNGTGAVNGESPPAAAIKQGIQRRRDQIALVPSGGNRYVTLNTTIEPLDDINVRKAISAAMNRDALRQSRGGPVVGDVATHYLPPGVPGFEEAGGAKGPGLDFLADPRGNPRLAAEYMRKAGFEAGRYDGREKLLVVGVRGEPGGRTAQIVQQQLKQLGFELTFRQVPPDTMQTKFCSIPSADVAVCPNMGWQKDFNDPQTILDATFNGEAIAPEGNANWPELDDPKVNAAMEKAELLTDPAERAKAWGEIDRMVTALAPGVPYAWDKQANIRSKDVNGKIWAFNGTWDLTETSIAR